MTPLSALAYVSSASAPMSEADLEALLASAREHNERVGVTGALLHHDGSFFQYVEGPADAVAEVYARVKVSSRHHGLIELFHRPVDRRLFDGWQMGFARAPRSLLLKLSQASWIGALTSATRSDPQAVGVKLLLEFWRNAVGRP
jgi:hypothetical protein